VNGWSGVRGPRSEIGGYGFVSRASRGWCILRSDWVVVEGAVWREIEAALAGVELAIEGQADINRIGGGRLPLGESNNVVRGDIAVWLAVKELEQVFGKGALGNGDGDFARLDGMFDNFREELLSEGAAVTRRVQRPEVGGRKILGGVGRLARNIATGVANSDQFLELPAGLEDDFEALDVWRQSALGGFVDFLAAAGAFFVGRAFLLLLEMLHGETGDGIEALGFQALEEALARGGVWGRVQSFRFKVQS